MKTEKNILIAFILNLSFSVFEFIGGTVCGSVAIISDSIHDLGDAASIGISYFLERKSNRKPDEKYTYGYARYSIIGSLIATAILLLGSAVMVYNSVNRIIHPIEINYNGMMLFAVVGVCVNFCAAFFTRDGDSLNQKAVNLHMLEDVLGWIVVLAGAILIRFTNFVFIDPIMSIGVSLFIIVNASKNLNEIFDIFLEKSPRGINASEIVRHTKEIDGVTDVHHVHLWTLDGQNNYATLHIVTDGDAYTVKEKLREELSEHGISHVTIETETSSEQCLYRECNPRTHSHIGHCHHK